MLRRALALSLALAVVTPARADETLQSPEADFRHFTDYCWFALGAASAFVAHEFGHVITDVAFGKSISFVPTKLGFIPFFAIQPCCNLTRREEWVIGSAGFMAQDVSSELILWIAPRLRSQRHAYLKGVLIFDVALSLGYAITGLANIGPPQSDVQTMARGLQVPPWEVGLMLLVPATVDVYRYLVPKSVWAPWVRVQSKVLRLGIGATF